MNQTFLARFPQQLKHWTFHCALNALPSFIIAAAWMKMYKQPACLAAMLLAITCFILAYATITSLPSPMNEKDSLPSRSIRLGAKIRSWIAGLSIPLVCSNGIFFAPDLWCGMLTVGAVNWIAKQFGHINPVIGMDKKNDPVTVFVTTLLEGTIISIGLLMLAFFTLLILQARTRKQII